MKRDLSTGQVASLLGVSPRTVCKWVDSGRLKGYKVPGSGGFRRVTREELKRFTQLHNLPMENGEENIL